ncbi:hypothetical protein [Nocardiopsis sp. YSL2]|uniref:hypothetical protein n=1 Tax=Nocardiopsis sp. YSL2 TaxID=2939492 RepID=UPI0026F47821|nr:hypothetical protein [Nocardiopsis sp. YSL2]
MTTAQWTRIGLVAAAVLGALAGMAWIVGGPSGRPVAWVGGGAAVLVLTVTAAVRVRRPTTAETTTPTTPCPRSRGCTW